MVLGGCVFSALFFWLWDSWKESRNHSLLCNEIIVLWHELNNNCLESDLVSHVAFGSYIKGITRFKHLQHPFFLPRHYSSQLFTLWSIWFHFCPCLLLIPISPCVLSNSVKSYFCKPLLQSAFSRITASIADVLWGFLVCFLWRGAVILQNKSSDYAGFMGFACSHNLGECCWRTHTCLILLLVNW